MAVLTVSKESFDRVISEETPTLVDFYADWCGPCLRLAPVIEEIAAAHPEMVFGKINVDEAPELAARFGIDAIPFLGLFKNGTLVRSLVGWQTKEKILAFLGL